MNGSKRSGITQVLRDNTHRGLMNELPVQYGGGQEDVHTDIGQTVPIMYQALIFERGKCFPWWSKGQTCLLKRAVGGCEGLLRLGQLPVSQSRVATLLPSSLN